MIKDDFINMRVSSKIKKEAEEILKELGLSISSAIDLYLIQIIKERGIPFELKLAKKEELEKEIKLVNIVNSLGGVEVNKDLQKIISLYAKGDINYDVALYAIKKELES